MCLCEVTCSMTTATSVFRFPGPAQAVPLLGTVCWCLPEGTKKHWWPAGLSVVWQYNPWDSLSCALHKVENALKVHPETCDITCPQNPQQQLILNYAKYICFLFWGQNKGRSPNNLSVTPNSFWETDFWGRQGGGDAAPWAQVWPSQGMGAGPHILLMAAWSLASTETFEPLPASCGEAHHGVAPGVWAGWFS